MTLLGQYIRSPRTVGTIMPSSQELADTMTNSVQCLPHTRIVELGAGSGIITKTLLDQGFQKEQLLVVEKNKTLAHLLEQEYQIDVINEDATELLKILSDRKAPPVDYILSSLPLLSLPHDVGKAVIEQMQAAIKPGGTIIQYTYGFRSPFHTIDHSVNLTATRTKRIYHNFPPAVVWKYQLNTQDHLH